MSALRDAAAGLVSKVRTQLLVEERGLEQSDAERRKAWAAIERDADVTMALVHNLEAVASSLEHYASLVVSRVSTSAELAIAAGAVVKAIEEFGGPPAPAPKQAPEWTRAGDVQLPLGDRAPESKPPP